MVIFIYELGGCGLRKIGFTNSADTVGRPGERYPLCGGRLPLRQDGVEEGSRWVLYVEGPKTRSRGRSDSVAELRRYDRGAGLSRGPDTSQTCSPRGRLAIAADLPM